MLTSAFRAEQQRKAGLIWASVASTRRRRKLIKNLHNAPKQVHPAWDYQTGMSYTRNGQCLTFLRQSKCCGYIGLANNWMRFRDLNKRDLHHKTNPMFKIKCTNLPIMKFCNQSHYMQS